jgi:hypothetical protein
MTDPSAVIEGAAQANKVWRQSAFMATALASRDSTPTAMTAHRPVVLGVPE